ncbi:MAG: hypothetical protein LBQ47_07615 [Endomicrobium sp.]|jgi:hypothetical protein|nr:hypothetical protein [Endomicrobium sp.]
MKKISFVLFVIFVFGSLSYVSARTRENNKDGIENTSAETRSYYAAKKDGRESRDKKERDREDKENISSGESKKEIRKKDRKKESSSKDGRESRDKKERDREDKENISSGESKKEIRKKDRKKESSSDDKRDKKHNKKHRDSKEKDSLKKKHSNKKKSVEIIQIEEDAGSYYYNENESENEYDGYSENGYEKPFKRYFKLKLSCDLGGSLYIAYDSDYSMPIRSGFTLAMESASSALKEVENLELGLGVQFAHINDGRYYDDAPINFVPIYMICTWYPFAKSDTYGAYLKFALGFNLYEFKITQRDDEIKYPVYASVGLGYEFKNGIIMGIDFDMYLTMREYEEWTYTKWALIMGYKI